MATILLQAVGGALGTLIGGPFGGIVGRALGALGGAGIDNALLSRGRHAEGPRLAAARIQDADEGAGIARVYGTARIAGQVIWTTRFEEATNTERQGGKGGGASVTTYSYFGNVGIGLCEGPIAGIRRVWADGEELDVTGVTLRLYPGDETQQPDPLIEAKQGQGKAPAYRGLAYAVFERLPLERWGNRIPQFSFEVLKPVGDLERDLAAVAIIPGASEHGLDPRPVRERIGAGADRVPNRNILHGSSDFLASLDELTGLCPKLERAALVVAWFGDDLRAGVCTIRPGVEAVSRDEDEPWRVGGTERAAARAISWNEGGPAYGGTPSDAGVVRALREMTARGVKATFYPFLLMDVPADNKLPDPYGGARQAAYPWRGRITLGGPADGTTAATEALRRFVGTAMPDHFALESGRVVYRGPAEWSYRRMVLHQAHLAKLAGGVDAFVIGSELRGLTRIRGADGGFPFVAALCDLATDVARVLPGTKLTYAADWSEYFGYQPSDGSGDVFFNLDPLWSHPAIAMVGIDNYLSIADHRDGDEDGSPYDVAALRQGIAGGENFDYYYASEADRRGGRRSPITDGLGKPWIFRAKDIRGWWENPHFERRGGVERSAPTAWVPCSKPVWFTELGCPAVDKGANQPNVFIDPKSAESFTPHFSAGGRDDLIQRRFLDAHLGYWDPADPGFVEANNPLSPVYGGRMVDPSAIHVWAWDARPYPAFPARTDLWRDGDNWRRGHWLSGRMGQAPVDALIRAVLGDHGFTDVDVSGVDAILGGYVAAGPGSARTELEDLQRLCGIVARSEAGRLVFRSISALGPAGRVEALVDPDDDRMPVERRRTEEGELPEEVVVRFMDPGRFYQPAAAEAGRGRGTAPRQVEIAAPVVLAEVEARRFAAGALGLAHAGQESLVFAAAPQAIDLDVGDVIDLEEAPGRWLVTRIEDGASRRIEARRLPSGVGLSAADTGSETGIAAEMPVQPSRPVVLFLDLPQGEAARPEDAARVACFASPFVPLGIEVSRSGGPFERRATCSAPATLGELVNAAPSGQEGVIDETAALEVRLYRGALFSVTRDALLAGSNLAAIRAANSEWEVIQFERAEEVERSRFRLSGLVRGRGGTEDAMAAGAVVGSPFVLLDAATEPLGLKASEIGVPMEWRVVPLGRPMDDPAAIRATVALGSRAVRPFSPVDFACVFAADGGLELTWARRSRIGGDDRQTIEPPLGEEIERYRVRLSAGGRDLTLDSVEQRLALPAEAQRIAFGSLPTEIAAGIAQYSLRHGAGTERLAVFRRPAA